MSIFKGDTIKFQVTIDDDITNWKIRAEISDVDGNSVKIATTNSGGSDSQIEKSSIGANSSVFILKFPSGETDEFNDEVTLEIEADTGATVNGKPEVYTVYQENLTLTKQNITWTTK